MAEGYFVVKSSKQVDDLKEGDRVNESDFATLTPSGKFVQMEYVKSDEEVSTEILPGLWKIIKTSRGLELSKTEFIKETVLDRFINTQEIEDSVECFFSNLQAYYDYGISVPKHSILIFGPPGGGKTTTINKVCRRYLDDNKTAVLVWNTDKYESYHVKDLIATFSYKDVEKIILVVEDLGGAEVQGAQMKSDASLLSLLDNKEKTFKIPTLIISTTNYPENFLGNLTNRPERFDDKIEVKMPTADARAELLAFFNKDKQPATQEAVDYLKSSKCKEFTPAHIKQAVIRAATKKKTLKVALESVVFDIERFNKGFSNRSGVSLTD